MSVPLKQQERSETALIVFTLLVPASVGMALFALLFGGGIRPAAVAVGLATAGMAGSITHLAKPLRAPTSLRNLKTSWLSREIAAVSVFWAFELAWLASEIVMSAGASIRLPLTASASTASLAFRALATVSGALLLAVIAQAYKVSPRPAWRGPECLMELSACALGAGCALYAASAELSCGGGSVIGAASAVAGIAGLALDAFSHRRRRARLEGFRERSDERVPLTLAHYDELRRPIRIAWAIEAVAVGFAAAGLFRLASLAQLAAHALHRWVFYQLPVQVRYVARLRK